MSQHASRRSRAAGALLLFAMLALSACGTVSGGAGDQRGGEAPSALPESTAESAGPALGELANVGSKVDPGEFPEYEDWYAGNEDTGDRPGLVGSNSSTGAIPDVSPFNFGRDPGGPEDKTLYLTLPRLGLRDVPVYDSVSEEDLRASTVHVPATGFPWQKGANVYIAGHRLGYEGTGSFRIFYDLPLLAEGDEIIIENSAGGVYVYRVTNQKTVGPGNVEVMDAVEGKSLLTLQTCTLPDYTERIVIQGELVDRNV